MTITSTSPAIPRQAPARAGGRSRPARGEGQWALGYREPLNKNEENKKNDDGLNVRQRIIDIYSKRGFDSIDPADLRGRFRWFGLYTQRKPGISGGRTATLEPEELDDRYFMLRVRIDGGQLDYDQLTTIADISRRYARGTADVTDRQNIQLHWIQIEDVPAIWEALEAVGLSTMEACGDTPRVILGCPLAGIDATEILDATPEIRRTHSRYIGNPEFSNLPRKFKSAISGCPVQCTLHEINDIAFAGVTGPDGTARVRPVGRRRAVHQPDDRQAARRVRPAGPGRRGVGRGDRDLQGLRLPAAAAPGPDQVPHRGLGPGAVQGGAGARLPRLPARRRPGAGADRRRAGTTSASTRRRTASSSSASRPPWAGLNADSLALIAKLAARYGSGRVRTTTEQKMVILDVPGEQTAALASELAAAGLPVTPSVFRRQTMACTGIEFCKLAIVETKHRAADLISELERRLPDFTEPVTINVNGCPNSCARIQTADIGLKGMVVTLPDGTQTEGYQIHLGGSLNGGRHRLRFRQEGPGAEDDAPRICRTTWSGCSAASTPGASQASRLPPGPHGPALRRSA